MRVIKLKQNKKGDFTDGNILITDLHTWMHKLTVTDNKQGPVEVPGDLACHCTVTNIGHFLSKLTLIFTSVDGEDYNFGAVSGSIQCFDSGENWEFFGRNMDLGFYDPQDKTTGNPGYSRIRGEQITESCDDGWVVKVYAIEEFSDEDYTGGLGTTE